MDPDQPAEHRQNTRRLSNRRLNNYYNQMSGLNQNVLGYELNRKQLGNVQNSLVTNAGYDGMTSLDYAELDLGQGAQANQASLGLGGQGLGLTQAYGQNIGYNQAYGQNLGYNKGQGQLGLGNGYQQGLNMYNQNGLYDQNIGYSNYAGYGYNPSGGVDRLGFDDYDYSYGPSVSYAYGGYGRQPGGCTVGGVSPLLGLIVIAGAGVGFYFLWEKVQSIGRRNLQLNFLEFLDYVYNGNFILMTFFNISLIFLANGSSFRT